MSERNLWGAVRNGLAEAAGLKIDLMRVENMVQEGCPDVNGCFDKAEFWVELKHTDRVPARDSTPIFTNGGLRDGQIIWLYSRAKRGGKCWILAQVGKALFLVHGRYAREFNQLTYPQMLAISSWYHTGRKVDWRELLEAIII